MTQSVPWSPASVERLPHPMGGEAGPRFSLDKVAEAAKAGSQDVHVRRWATHVINDNGRPQTDRERAELLLYAVRKQCAYIPDPINTEFVAGAHLLLPPAGEARAIFGGGDCDDLVAAFASAAASVGVHTVILGHSYARDRVLSHVLAAIADTNAQGEVTWYYADPSTERFGFGLALEPTREVVISLDGDRVCDSGRCLTGSQVIPIPTPHGSGSFVGVAALPRFLGDAPAPIDIEQLTEPQWREWIGGWIAFARELISDLITARQQAADTSSDLGFAFPSSTAGLSFNWDADHDTQLFTLKQQLDLIATCLQEVLDGKRRLFISEGPLGRDYQVEGLPDDPYRLVTDLQGNVSLVDKSGKPVALQGVGVAPLVAVGAAALVVVALAQMWLLSKVAAQLFELLTRLSEERVHKAYVDAVKNKDLTPDEAARLQKGIQDGQIRRAQVANEAAAQQNEPLKLVEKVIIATSVAGLALGAFKLAQDSGWLSRQKRRNDAA